MQPHTKYPLTSPGSSGDSGSLHCAYISSFYAQSSRFSNSGTPDSRVHVYDVYDNELSETREMPCTTRRVFEDFEDPTLHDDARKLLDAAERRFMILEEEAESTVTDLLSHAQLGEGVSTKIPLKRRALENLRTFLVFLRFRNSEQYRQIVQSLRAGDDDRDKKFHAFNARLVHVHRSAVLGNILAFLQQTSADIPTRMAKQRSRHNASVPLDAIETYCWRFCQAELCVGIASEEQEFILSDACFGTLDEGFAEDPECCDLFFPIIPTVAIYVLGDSSIPIVPNPATILIETGIESASDVHLRNALIFQTYPHHLYFSNLRAIALAVSSYDEFRWTQEHQDYSRLKQRCRQKFLQETVTKTLVVKGSRARGTWGFLGCLDGQMERPRGETTENGGIKILRQVMAQGVREKLLKRLQAEVTAWHRLSHRNVSQLFGIIQSPNSLGMVSPWYDNGTICEYLRKNPEADRVKLLLQVASGIAYLHSAKPIVVHGDLKGGNILIDEHGIAVITDFGLSKVMEDISDAAINIGTSFFAGSTRWMAPELIQALVEDDGRAPPITPQSDVYAFASVCLEIATGKPPYPHRTNDHAVIVDILRGVKPSRGVNTVGFVCGEDADAFWSMLDKCWDMAVLRPTMPDMVRFFGAMAG
ncbi:kinase-like domain-containing protein [Infundibulicybe gibba]|nr:kinase-like domain-containing protein [Infundibulicybe gibba]